MNINRTKSFTSFSFLNSYIAKERKTKSILRWTPARWLLYQSRILKKREKYNADQIEMAIKRLLPEAAVLLPDWEYWTTNVQDYMNFLELDDTDKAEYVDDFYDCDDFAYRLMGQLHHPLYGAFAHGISWSSVHAFNCFIDWNLDLYLVEPQTDEIALVKVGELPIDYKPEIIFM
jgi:hypothetical protein